MFKFFNISLNQWLKSFHVLFTCFWLGSVFSVIIIYFATPNNISENSLIISNSELIKKIDYYIIIPFSSLSYFTGILISWKTNWGFFRYKWIICKLLVSTLLILFGVFFLAPWIYRSSYLMNNNYDEYLLTQKKLGISMIVQFFIIVFLVFISTIKPWKKFK